MKKVKFFGSIICLILLVLLNVLYYGVGGIHQSPSAWISYCFIHLSYIITAVELYLLQRGKDQIAYIQFVYVIPFAYFITEFIVGIIFIIGSCEKYKFFIDGIILLMDVCGKYELSVDDLVFITDICKNYKVSLFCQMVIVAIYLVVLLVNMIADEHTSEAVKKHETELRYVKESYTMMKIALSGIENKKLYQKVENALDLIQSSPVKSHSNVHEIECQIMCEIERLCFAVSSGDTDEISAAADNIVSMANERNQLLKRLN